MRLKSAEQDGLIEEIHCKYLELDLTTNIITSEQNVVVLGKDFTMYGAGLAINLNTKQMTLAKDIKTTYQKNYD